MDSAEVGPIPSYAYLEIVLKSLKIRDMMFADASAVVSLNRAVVDVTSPMDIDGFADLYELSTTKLVAEVNGGIVAFVMVIPDGKPYDNGNYRWFSERLKNFAYIDRVVVSADWRGFGIGRLIYSRVYDAALQSGKLNVCAEMDLEPPNRESLLFHEKAGFVQTGTRVLGSGKRVSMQIRPVTDSGRNA